MYIQNGQYALVELQNNVYLEARFCRESYYNNICFQLFNQLRWTWPKDEWEFQLTIDSAWIGVNISEKSVYYCISYMSHIWNDRC